MSHHETPEARLTDAAIRDRRERGRMSDGRNGHGLFVNFRPLRDGTLSRVFAQQSRIDGEVHILRLGKYPDVSLEQARKKAEKNWRKAQRGEDPLVNCKVPTFRVVADQVISSRRVGWKEGSKTEKDWKSSLDSHAMGILGDKPVNQITEADVIVALDPIWVDIPAQARRVLARVKVVLDLAVAQGWIRKNPAHNGIEKSLPRQSREVEHHRALSPHEVGAAIAAVNASGASVPTKLAFRFQALTAARIGDVLSAEWDEIDLEARVWERTRIRWAHRAHRIPLSNEAVVVLEEARAQNPSSRYVFPSLITGKPLGRSTLGALCRRLGIDGTMHRFRAAFRVWCAENGVPWQYVEVALAHVIRGMEMAFVRMDYLEQRRTLMQAWSDFISAQVEALKSDSQPDDS